MIQWLLIWVIRITSQVDVVNVYVPPVNVSSGKQTIIIIQVQVQDGYHIQAHKSMDPLLIKTTLFVDKAKHLKTGEPVYPRGGKLRLEGTDVWLDVYSGRFEISVPLKVTRQAQKGLSLLNAVLHYQACDAKNCFQPATLSFQIPVQVN